MDDGRLLHDNQTDHAAWLWITTVIGLVLVVCAAAYRVMQRWKSWTRESWDDHVAALTFVLAIIHSAVTFPALKNGFGKLETTDNETSLRHAAKYAFASKIIAAAVMCASQASVVMTLARIVHIRRKNWICTSAVILSCVTFLIVLLLLAVSCPAASTMSGIQETVCRNMDGRLIAVAVLESISETVPLGLAMYFFWDLQMTTDRKWHAIVGYVCRLSNVLLLAVSTHLSIHFRTSAGRTTIDAVPAFIVQSILVMSEYLCVVAIYLARAMNDFQTAGPAITLSSAKDYSNSGGLGGRTKSKRLGSGTMGMKSLRSDTHGVLATITHEDRGGGGSDADSESSQRGIVKRIEYEVHYDERMSRMNGRANEGSEVVEQPNCARARSVQWEEQR